MGRSVKRLLLGGPAGPYQNAPGSGAARLPGRLIQSSIASADATLYIADKQVTPIEMRSKFGDP